VLRLVRHSTGCEQRWQEFNALDRNLVRLKRVGDEITVQSVKFHGFIENALNRPKVYYRFMLVKCAKGDLPTRTTLFLNNADNKMIDELNTERYSIIASKIFTVTPSNGQAANASGLEVRLFLS
jgi:hypothetical protein